MSVRWRIELLNGFRIARGERDDFRFSTRKTAALLAYLAYYANKSFTRETLADQFWPDNDPESARNSLRVALNSLRKLLDVADGQGEPLKPGEELLLTDRASVQLNPAVFSTDVADFEATLKAERDGKTPEVQRNLLVEAATLYKGPLLPGWYEEWISGEQTRLAEVYATALRRLTGLLMETQEYDRALDYARRAAQADPLREETHRLLIRLHSLAGNTAAALAQYRDLEHRLDQELGTVPSRVTRELMRQVLSADRGEASATAAPARKSAVATVASVVTSTPALEATPRVEASATIAPPTEVRPSTTPVRFVTQARPITRFFGREAEMKTLKELLSPRHTECCRLVTITGMGGTGKTRLAQEITNVLVEAAQAPSAIPSDVFSGGIWLVPLADINHAAMLEKAVAQALSSRTAASTPPVVDGDGNFWEQIIGTLNQTLPTGQSKPVLLVLDNFEQLVDGGSDWLGRLMQTVPGLSCLVTSRQRLDVAGEQEIPLAPLPVPDMTQAADTGKKLDIDAYPGVRLFVDRARGVRPDFALNERNTASIAELCARLDGLPLALELAAAWARLLTPAQMLDRLNARFDLLVAAHRDISPRHRSLRAVLDETTRLMPDELRQVFAALSVFRGGWTLTAVETVLIPVIGKTDMLEMMAMLQQRSLVFVAERAEEARFYLLETVREYAATLLDEKEVVPIRSAHAAYFSDFARTVAPHLNRIDSDMWSNRLEEERDNLRAALDVMKNTDEEASTLPLAVALWRYWYARGPAEEGLDALLAYLREHEPAKPNSIVQAVHRAQAYEGAGRLALALGQATSACQLFDDGLKILPASAGEEGKSRAGTLATNLALAARACGDPDAAALAYEIVLREKRAEGDLWGAAFALSELGMAYLQIGMPEKAATALHEGYLLHTLLGDRGRATECRSALARIEGKGGDMTGGDAETGTTDAIAGSYLTLGHVAVEQEDFTAALPLLEEARRGFLAVGDAAAITLTYERIALAALGAGDVNRARHALEEARARREGDAIDKSADTLEQSELRLKHRAWLQVLLRQTQATPGARLTFV